jgi:hypothetical protein
MSPWVGAAPDARPAFVESATMAEAGVIEAPGGNRVFTADGRDNVQPPVTPVRGPDTADLLAGMPLHDAAPKLFFDPQPEQGGVTLVVSRTFVIVVDFDLLSSVGRGQVQDDLPLDQHNQYAAQPRDLSVQDHSAILSPNNVRSPAGEMPGVPASAEGPSRSGATLTPITFSVGSEATFVGAAPNTGIVQPTLDGSTSESLVEMETAPSSVAVGHLVAFGKSAGSWAAWASTEPDAADDALVTTAATAIHDLLLPQFTLDGAALGAAISDLVSEAEELGGDLMALLTDAISSREATLVAGAVAAGVAWWQWRDDRHRHKSEAWQIISARFITGPESLRVRKSTTRLTDPAPPGSPRWTDD